MDEIEGGLQRALQAAALQTPHGELFILMLAPYAAAAYLGRRLDDLARGQRYLVFQLTRDTSEWEPFLRSSSAATEGAESYFESLHEPPPEADAPAILLVVDGSQLIADVARNRLEQQLGAITYHLRPRTRDPISPVQIAAAMDVLRRTVQMIATRHPRAALHIITSAPVALVFELGRMLSPSAFRSAVIHHFVPATTSHIPVLDVVQRKIVVENSISKGSASSITLHVKNFYALREVHWSPTGICAVIGANGAGKTTLLLVLKLLRTAVNRGLPHAVTSVLGGGHDLRHWGAPEDEAIELGLEVGGLSWKITLETRGATVDYLANEELRREKEVIFSKDSLGNFLYRGNRREPDERVGLRAIADGLNSDPDIETMLTCIQGICVFHDPDLWGLRQHGSQAYQVRQLFSRSTNAFAMLREWSLSPTDRPRYLLVLDGLRAAFPTLCGDLEFDKAGETITVWVVAPGREQPSPIRNAANGLLSMLVLLCDVAAADDGGLVAIDEPENGLHPFAIREFMRRASAWGRQHGLTIVLTTHSPVLLDELTAEPSQVFVMRTDAPGPIPLHEHRNRDWLANFRLGELYADGELGSNDDIA